ncbi:MAG: hypothetical protein L0F95_06235 [Lactococcus sp.]|nr:hypothetical protein [Lactococcus sp.]MDN5411994.1 hypothetical protein [Lactococcus sp.]MDN5466379.1 hypothetical protein [Lactococcus sp.]MDN6013306.1 hypothetical protein [Lactococcus sp.]MDN6106608.1 hypothetical protein [Lactococcus sp.]MDN6524143.1 hypothetical protein [Lactococcus sp.]
MKQKKAIAMILISLMSLFFLSACHQKRTPIISADKLDKAVILIKDDQGRERTWEASDLSFLKALLGNLNLVFGKDDKSAQDFDTPLTAKEKAFTYQITFYQSDKVVQPIHMSQTMDITVDKKQFTVRGTDRQALDSLKQQLLVVAK